ncbi:MAG TPA: peptidoglycan-associated lipoprotein Pal [Gammaproteobacteria bacterium]|nr:peptidoglycan-associated lipoprotein Pal [Gammaproteobacteria bacterium]
MFQKGGKIAWLGLTGLLVLGGCATPGEKGPEGGQPQAGQEGGAAEGGQEGATAQGLGGAEGGQGSALGEQAEAQAVKEPEEHRVFFDFDSAKLSDQARDLINAHAEYLKAHPAIHVVLEGNADERGSREYNLALGERRAKSVRRILLVHGIASSRLEVVSYGEERPLVEGHNKEAYSRNRRVKLRYERGNEQG